MENTNKLKPIDLAVINTLEKCVEAIKEYRSLSYKTTGGVWRLYGQLTMAWMDLHYYMQQLVDETMEGKGND